MTPDTQAAPQKRDGNATITFLSVLVVALIGAVIFLGALYHNAKNQNSDTTVSATKSASSPTPTLAKSIFAVKSLGYPFEMPKNSIATSLSLPNSVGAVRIGSSIQNPGANAGYTDKFNDEMGRWSIGYLADDPTGSNSEISMVALSSSWLNATTKNPPQGAPASPAEKAKFITDLKTRTSSCVKDATTGFKTKSDVFNVCYTVASGVDGYTPSMTLEGYAELNGKPFYLTGYIRIHDGLNYDSQWSKMSGQIRSDFVAKNYPTQTKQQIDSFVSALSQTQVVVSAR